MPTYQQMFKQMEKAWQEMQAYMQEVDADKFLQAQNQLSHDDFSFKTFLKNIGIQSEIYTRFGLYPKSFLGQINQIFSPEFIDEKTMLSLSGIVFIDFDNTIFHEKYGCYNGVVLESWKNIFSELKSKGFLIVLLSSRLPFFGENADFQKIIYIELKGYIDKILLIGELAVKGYCMRYILQLIKMSYQLEKEPHEKKAPIFRSQNYWLIDDNKKHLLSTQPYFKCIETYPHKPTNIPSVLEPGRFTGQGATVIQKLLERPDPDFIQQIRAIGQPVEDRTAQSAQLPPPSPLVSPRSIRRAETVGSLGTLSLTRPESVAPSFPPLTPQTPRTPLQTPQNFSTAAQTDFTLL